MDRDKIVRAWKDGFKQFMDALTKEATFPSFRKCAMLWQVSGILYEKHDAAILPDWAYDLLCKYLLDNYRAVVLSGADILEGDLRAGTAMGWRKYTLPAHYVAEVLSDGGPVL